MEKVSMGISFCMVQIKKWEVFKYMEKLVKIEKVQ